MKNRLIKMILEAVGTLAVSIVALITCFILAACGADSVVIIVVFAVSITLNLITAAGLVVDLFTGEK